jgi:hypothetical protein
MRLPPRGVRRQIVIGIRAVLLSLKLRPRRPRSWRHHRLALGVGYFTLSYSRLEQEFIAQACGLANTRGQILHGRDKEAEYEAYRQAQSIDASGFKKTAAWAKQARQMTTDAALLSEIDRLVSDVADLSALRQSIIHNFRFMGDQHTLIRPPSYVQAYQYIKADWGKKYENFKPKMPIMHRYTYRDLKELDAFTTSLIDQLQDLRRRLAKDFYRATHTKFKTEAQDVA